VICARQSDFSPVPASRIAALTAFSPALISAAIMATRSGAMSSFNFKFPQTSFSGYAAHSFQLQNRGGKRMIDRDAYVEKAKANIDKWNAEIDKMQANAKEAQADAKIKYEKQLAEMRKQRDEAEAKMKEAQQASDAAWGDMRKGFETAWDSLSESFQSAMKRFK
jgi:hypothetical protein